MPRSMKPFHLAAVDSHRRKFCALYSRSKTLSFSLIFFQQISVLFQNPQLSIFFYLLAIRTAVPGCIAFINELCVRVNEHPNPNPCFHSDRSKARSHTDSHSSLFTSAMVKLIVDIKSFHSWYRDHNLRCTKDSSYEIHSLNFKCFLLFLMVYDKCICMCNFVLFKTLTTELVELFVAPRFTSLKISFLCWSLRSGELFRV